jgi:hypothetical protein
MLASPRGAKRRHGYALLVIRMASFKQATSLQPIGLFGCDFQDGRSTRSVWSILKEVVQPSRLGGAINTHRISSRGAVCSVGSSKFKTPSY